ncbi:hypothetical protein QTG54_015781 [Skeletonema marinoi]|uniref:Uncharacterized protein n=1 Tax=Skeletonema marinoi TaxID=267567 RepID=A0AAD8XTS2_9STRA|nr:hypothetical protein QTG54_015781 [Skeletonema marinoi]
MTMSPSTSSSHTLTIAMIKRLVVEFENSRAKFLYYGDHFVEQQTGLTVRIKQEDHYFQSLCDYEIPSFLYWEDTTELLTQLLNSSMIANTLSSDEKLTIEEAARQGHIFVVHSDVFRQINDCGRYRYQTHPFVKDYMSSLLRNSGWAAIISQHGQLSICDRFVLLVRDLNTDSLARFNDLLHERNDVVAYKPLGNVSNVEELIIGEGVSQPDVVSSVKREASSVWEEDTDTEGAQPVKRSRKHD